MRRALVLAIVAGCGGGGGGSVADGPPGDTNQSHGFDAPGDPLIGAGDAELVQGGYQFVEGPQWRDATGDLVFSDINGNTIYRYDPTAGGAPTVLRTPSNNSNGLALDANGDLLAAEHGSRSITLTTTTGTTTVVDHYMGMRLNSPNDLIEHAGTIYFTDPPYGITDAQRELPFIGVFRIDPTGALTAEREGALTERPNGVVFDAIHQRLLIPDTDDGNVYGYDMMADGTLAPRAVFVQTSGNPDGLATDLNGNVFVATATGIEVFSALGDRWGVIAVPEQPANCAFGDADHRTLYITARTGLYRVRLVGPGYPTN